MGILRGCRAWGLFFGVSMSPTAEQFRIAAITNLFVWSQISETAIGRRGPGAALAGAAMVLASQVGSVERLPPLLRAPVQLLTLPGSLAVREQTACCNSCAAGKK